MNIGGNGGELRMTIEIKRAATGEVETHELVGKITSEQAEQLNLKEQENGSDPLDSGT